MLHKWRPKGKIWVYFDLKNPANIQLEMSELDAMFNWTHETNADTGRIRAGLIPLLKPGVQFALKNINLANKDRLVVWTVSNCCR